MNQPTFPLDPSSILTLLESITLGGLATAYCLGPETPAGVNRIILAGGAYHNDPAGLTFSGIALEDPQGNVFPVPVDMKGTIPSNVYVAFQTPLMLTPGFHMRVVAPVAPAAGARIVLVFLYLDYLRQ